MPTSPIARHLVEETCAAVRAAVADGFETDHPRPGRSAFQEAAKRLGLHDGTLRSRLRSGQRVYGITDDFQVMKAEREPAGITGPATAPYDPPSKAAPELADQIHALLLRSRTRVSIEDLSDRFNVGITRVRQALEILRSSGKNLLEEGGSVEVPKDIAPEREAERIDISRFKGKTIKFGLTADNHLGSKYERLDVLNALFDIWAAEGVETILQCGNMIDGEARFNRFDIHKTGMEAQVRYFVETWPARKGMRTRFIAGDDHEGWYVQREGANIGVTIEMAAQKAGRTDLEYLGYMERDLILGDGGAGRSIKMMHAGGGSSYALSYTSQKIVESLQGGEKPAILLIGHYHKYDVCYPRNVLAIQVGCTQDQTPFMRKKRLEAHLGGVTLEIEIGKDGLFHVIGRAHV